MPLAVVGVLATALAYAAGITAAGLLGSRLSSFAGLLEVVAATVYAWLLLGESLGALQLVGGVLILAGIQLIGVGLLGELQVRHFFTQSQRSPYTVDRIVRIKPSEESLSR